MNAAELSVYWGAAGTYAKTHDDWTPWGERVGSPEEQIIGILNEADAGAQVRDLCRRQGIAETRFYRWRNTCGGLDRTEARRLNLQVLKGLLGNE